MATNITFRNFLQDQVVGLNAETAREVVDVHGINTMKRLADLTRAGIKDLANLIRKQRVLNVAPLPDRYIVSPREWRPHDVHGGRHCQEYLWSVRAVMLSLRIYSPSCRMQISLRCTGSRLRLRETRRIPYLGELWG